MKLLMAVALVVAAAALILVSLGGQTGRAPGPVGTPAGYWQGDKVHLVDGVWIGQEQACLPENVECATIVDLALAELPPGERAAVKTAVVAELPSEYAGAGFVAYRVKTTGGVNEYTAVVVQLDDGTRRLIGLLCYLPHLGVGSFEVKYARCFRDPLAQWRDGVVPRPEQ